MNPEQLKEWVAQNFLEGGGNRVEHPEIFPAGDRGEQITDEMFAHCHGARVTYKDHDSVFFDRPVPLPFNLTDWVRP